MVPFLSTIARFVDSAGKILSPHLEYLQQFTIAPPPFLAITVTGSPFAYEAKEPGHVSVTGGTVSSITLTRGIDTIIVGIATRLLVPVAINDIVSVTYTVLPTVKFIPSYGQNTNT